MAMLAELGLRIGVGQATKPSRPARSGQPAGQDCFAAAVLALAGLEHRPTLLVGQQLLLEGGLKPLLADLQGPCPQRGQ